MRKRDDTLQTPVGLGGAAVVVAVFSADLEKSLETIKDEEEFKLNELYTSSEISTCLQALLAICVLSMNSSNSHLRMLGLRAFRKGRTSN